MPLPPPVTNATLLTLVELLRFDEPAREAEPLKIQRSRHGLQRRSRHGDRLAALDVVDDVIHPLLFEQLLGLPGRICLARNPELGVGGKPAPRAVWRFGGIGDESIGDSQVL